MFSDNHRIYSKCKHVHLIFTGSCTELSPVLSGRQMQLFVSDRWEFEIPVMHRSAGSRCKPLLGHPSSSFTMTKEGKKRAIGENGPNAEVISLGNRKNLEVKYCLPWIPGYLHTLDIFSASKRTLRSICIYIHSYIHIKIHTFVYLYV